MSTKRVLVAEDSSVIQNLTRKILENQNFEITAVKNGKDVLSKIEKESFDIILLDINMPKMNGIDCAKNIRGLADKDKAGIPILAITGNALNMTEDEFHEAGFNDYLTKPLDFDALVEKVKKFTT